MNPIDKALEILDHGNNWYKYSEIGLSSFLSTKKPCLVLAINISTDMMETYKVKNILRSIIKNNYSKNTISGFNDDNNTTWEDIELVCKEASIEWDKLYGPEN